MHNCFSSVTGCGGHVILPPHSVFSSLFTFLTGKKVVEGGGGGWEGQDGASPASVPLSITVTEQRHIFPYLPPSPLPLFSSLTQSICHVRLFQVELYYGVIAVSCLQCLYYFVCNFLFGNTVAWVSPVCTIFFIVCTIFFRLFLLWRWKQKEVPNQLIYGLTSHSHIHSEGGQLLRIVVCLPSAKYYVMSRITTYAFLAS